MFSLTQHYYCLLLLSSEFLTSQLWLGNIHLSWDVINRIRLGGLICSLKIFSQLNMCQELQIYYYYYYYYYYYWGTRGRSWLRHCA